MGAQKTPDTDNWVSGSSFHHAASSTRQYVTLTAALPREAARLCVPCPWYRHWCPKEQTSILPLHGSVSLIFYFSVSKSSLSFGCHYRLHSQSYPDSVLHIVRYVFVQLSSLPLDCYCTVWSEKAFTINNILERTAIHLAATRLSFKLALMLILISQKAAFIKDTNRPCGFSKPLYRFLHPGKRAIHWTTTVCVFCKPLYWY